MLPPIRLKWAHLCTESQFGRGRFHIPQPLQSVFVPSNRPFVWPMGELALMMDASASQGTQHRLRVQLTELLSGEARGDAREYPLTFDSIGDGYRLLAPFRVPLQGWPAPGPGDYAFRLSVGDTVVGTVPVRLIRGSGPHRFDELLPAPTRPDAPRLELRWAHILADFDAQAFRVGKLPNIVEYLRVPKRQREVNLGTYALVMLLEGEMVDGIALVHQLRVRTLDANGQDVFPEGDYRSTPDFVPLSENRLGRRTIIQFAENATLRVGDYTFEIYLDGQHLGTLDFSVLPQQ